MKILKLNTIILKNELEDNFSDLETLKKKKSKKN